MLVVVTKAFSEVVLTRWAKTSSRSCGYTSANRFFALLPARGGARPPSIAGRAQRRYESPMPTFNRDLCKRRDGRRMPWVSRMAVWPMLAIVLGFMIFGAFPSSEQQALPPLNKLRRHALSSFSVDP